MNYMDYISNSTVPRILYGPCLASIEINVDVKGKNVTFRFTDELICQKSLLVPLQYTK